MDIWGWLTPNRVVVVSGRGQRGSHRHGCWHRASAPPSPPPKEQERSKEGRGRSDANMAKCEDTTEYVEKVDLEGRLWCSRLGPGGEERAFRREEPWEQTGALSIMELELFHNFKEMKNQVAFLSWAWAVVRMASSLPLSTPCSTSSWVCLLIFASCGPSRSGLFSQQLVRKYTGFSHKAQLSDLACKYQQPWGWGMSSVFWVLPGNTYRAPAGCWSLLCAQYTTGKRIDKIPIFLKLPFSGRKQKINKWNN